MELANGMSGCHLFCKAGERVELFCQFLNLDLSDKVWIEREGITNMKLRLFGGGLVKVDFADGSDLGFAHIV